MPRTEARTLQLRRRASPLARLLALISTLMTRRRDRTCLARLDSHLLRDIGLEPEVVAGECAKSFWQA